MTRFSDAGLLKGDFATMLKEPPKEAEWKKTACDNSAEAAAQAIAKQIFAMQQGINSKNEKLEIVTFSSLGPIKVLAITPIDGELMRIDGVHPDGEKAISILQHTEQLSLTFSKAKVESGSSNEEPGNDDGMQIGFVIFDELTERKKVRDAAKNKKSKRKNASPKGKPRS